jgi:glucosamine 6-phosphate synthetase-like amidotransferase/phosphosugar isomerase protein
MDKTMYDYMLEQPAILKDILENRAAYAGDFAAWLKAAGPDRIYLIASGTSNNAALQSARFMEYVLGIEVSVGAPSFLPEIRGANPLLIFISQGGGSTNTIAACESLEQYPRLAMTGKEQSRLRDICPRHILIPCGEETAGPKTKGYTATALTLYVMALEGAAKTGLSAGKERRPERCLEVLSQVPGQMAKNIEALEQWFGENKQDLGKMRGCAVVGKNTAGLVAREAALKLQETMLIPAAGYEFEEFLHGPVCAAAEGQGGIYFMPPPEDSDYQRMAALAAFHREISPLVYTLGPGGDRRDKRDCPLAGTGYWYTSVFEDILACQLMGAKLPELNGAGDEGMRRFKKLDQTLAMKFKT